jgi:hypothetical protein
VAEPSTRPLSGRRFGWAVRMTGSVAEPGWLILSIRCAVNLRLKTGLRAWSRSFGTRLWSTCPKCAPPGDGQSCSGVDRNLGARRLGDMRPLRGHRSTTLVRTSLDPNNDQPSLRLTHNPKVAAPILLVIAWRGSRFANVSVACSISQRNPGPPHFPEVVRDRVRLCLRPTRGS